MKLYAKETDGLNCGFHERSDEKCVIYLPSGMRMKAVAKHKMPENKYVECSKEHWWNDLEVYDNFKTKLL